LTGGELTTGQHAASKMTRKYVVSYARPGSAPRQRLQRDRDHQDPHLLFHRGLSFSQAQRTVFRPPSFAR
jgi:hypothetical protein